MSNLQIEDLIKLLEDADPEQLAKLAIEMNKAPQTRKSKVEHGSIKSYTKVIKEVTCLMCNSKITYKHNLQKGEQLNCIDTKGFGHTITSTGKEGTITVASTASKCEMCACVIKGWSREELERRFLAMLNNTTFKEVINYTLEVNKDVSQPVVGTVEVQRQLDIMPVDSTLDSGIHLDS